MNLMSVLTIAPIYMPVNVELAVVLLGAAYILMAAVIQRKLSNPVKMREIQTRIKELTKEMQDMAKRNLDVKEKQNEIMPLMGQSMKLQMKSMFVVLPIFYAVYYVVLPQMFGAFALTDANIFIPLTLSGLFFAVVLIGGLALSMGILSYDKRKAKAAAAQVQDTSKQGQITAK